MSEIIEKQLSANDVGETGGHQSGPYIGRPRTVPDFFPELDLAERDPHTTLTFLDGRGQTYQFEFRYWTAKDEYHLSHMTGFFRDHDVSSGDILVLRRDDDGTLHIDTRDEHAPPEGSFERREGVWVVRSIPDIVDQKGGSRQRAVDARAGADPEEENLEGLPEGARQRVVVNRYERSQQNREKCLQVHGTSCLVCGMNFGEEYGPVGDGFIHVHHVIPLPELGEGYVVDPTRDLVPVCPNCHAMLHRRTPAYTIEELRAMKQQDPE